MGASPNPSSQRGVQPPTFNQAATARASEIYRQAPLYFEANLGQADSQAKFLTHGDRYGLFLTANEAVLVFSPPAARRSRDQVWAALYGKDQERSLMSLAPEASALRLKLATANPAPEMVGMEPLPSQSNYFIGNDPKQWTTNVPHYAKVLSKGVYPGIDLVYHGQQRQLEYDLVVAPQADPTVIKFTFEGADQVSVDGNGDLVLRAKGSEIRQHKPTVYQEIDGQKQAISGGYVLRENSEVGFALGAYDKSRPLTIDPVLSYASYLGDGGDDYGNGVAVDSAGNIYVAGYTESGNFPILKALQPSLHGSSDAFVTKLSSSGALIYSTYLGGKFTDVGFALAIDSAGNAYVTGNLDSPDFPVTPDAFQRVKGGNDDAFVAKLNAAGNALLYATYLGGSNEDAANSIAVDGAGNAYVTGTTNSSDFPTSNALQASNGGLYDAFVTKLNTTGRLAYSTYLGGQGNDGAYGIAVDTAGNAYVTGFAENFFPLKSPFQASFRGRVDAFVTKLNAAGNALVYSTYLGGSAENGGFAIAVDTSGNAYVTGLTNSSDFPTQNPVQAATGGNDDAFITKLNPAGTALVYSTYLGGSENDTGFGIAVDAFGAAYVAGKVRSLNLAVVNPLQPKSGGDADVFVGKLNPAGSAFVYLTYLGGSGEDEAFAIAVDSTGNAYLVGLTDSPNFPTNPVKPPVLRSVDAFVAKISDGPQAIATVSAASFSGSALASESIAVSFGSDLATAPLSATLSPPPSSLMGTTVKVTDSAGIERLAPLFYVSPTQVNFLIPVGTVTGPTEVAITNGQGAVSRGMVQIENVAPGLFSADSTGQGVAAALAVRVKADGSQATEPIVGYDPAQNALAAQPIDLGPETDQVFLMLFGTGIRYQSTVTATIGGEDAQVWYAGPQGGFLGLDQVNLRLPRTLLGRGTVDILLLVDNKPANIVRVIVK